jgi:hypothetical protein
MDWNFSRKSIGVKVSLEEMIIDIILIKIK